MKDFLTEFDSKLFDALSNTAANRVFFFYADIKNFKSRWSKSAVEYFGLPGEILEPASIWDDKIHPDDVDEYNKDFQNIMSKKTPYHNCEYRITNAAGEYVWVNCRGYMTYDEDGSPEFFAGFVSNLGVLAKIDSVTGLWTNYSFRNDISGLLDGRRSGAAIQIDIRNFKRINSRYGYEFGDLVLYSIGQEIYKARGGCKRVYRFEGTQFALIIENGSKEDVLELKNRIIEQISEISVNGIKLYIDASFAATLFPQDGRFVDQVQNNLSYAIANAKQTNSNDIIFYSKEIHEQRNRIIRLTDALMESIQNDFNGFHLAMQPIMDAESGELYSAEMLLRWRNEEFPNVGPMEFIPLLEQTANIISVGKWVIDRAFRYVAEWNKLNTRNKLRHVNINFSYIQFTDLTLKDYIVAKLDEYKLPHDMLIAELTESCRIEYTDKLAQILQEMRDEGIIIALDDFGTGYASLMVLKDIPADIIKLDHTMTRTIVDRPKDRNLVEFIIEYCNRMDIDVCTEGVETDETLQIVKSAHAKYIQGYYYDKPLESETFYNKYIA